MKDLFQMILGFGLMFMIIAMSLDAQFNTLVSEWFRSSWLHWLPVTLIMFVVIAQINRDMDKEEKPAKK